jgi:hypothetical protein
MCSAHLKSEYMELRQEEFEARLRCTARPCLKKETTQKDQNTTIDRLREKL